MRISDCSSYVCSSDLHRTVRKGTLVKLLYFAWLKTRTGMAEEEVTPPEGVATVGELLSWLEGRGPNFAAAFSDSRAIRVAVNQAYAQPGDPVRTGDPKSVGEGKRVAERVDLGGGRIVKQKTTNVD